MNCLFFLLIIITLCFAIPVVVADGTSRKKSSNLFYPCNSKISSSDCAEHTKNPLTYF